MPSRKPAVLQLGDELWEVDTANTKEVRLIHRVTGERRTVPHHELADLVNRGEHRAPQQLDTLPKHVIAAANALAIDIDEVVTGVGRNGKRRPRFDPETTSQETRITRKLEDLENAGRPIGRAQFFVKMKNYKRDGLIGLVDGRSLRQYESRVETLHFDVLNALIDAIDEARDRSTGTTSRIIHEVTELLKTKNKNLKLPSRSRFYQLIDDLGGHKHTTKSAKTRRSLGNRPDRTFAKQEALLPGSYVQLDTNTMDIHVQGPAGEGIRPELAIMTDVYSRSIVAFTIRLGATKSVDHMMLLAQAITPRQNRPSRRTWRDTLSRKFPDLKLMLNEDYEAAAAAIPFIHPRNVTIDRGSTYTSATFKSASRQLGCSIILSAPYTPTSKPHVERQFATVNSMFTQYLNGYLGRSPEHKGKDAPYESLLTVEALRELFEDWVVGTWQVRPHSSIRDPVGGRLLSPNEKAARANLIVEPLRMALNRDAYIRMLDSKFRTIQSTGIKWNNCQYDSELLHELRHMRSRHPRHDGKWEVKVNPYDPSVVWVIGRNGELIECPERGSEYRYLMPDFAPVDDARNLTAHSEGELVGTPFPTATLPEHITASPVDDDEDDDLPLFTDI